MRAGGVGHAFQIVARLGVGRRVQLSSDTAGKHGDLAQRLLQVVGGHRSKRGQFSVATLKLGRHTGQLVVRQLLGTNLLVQFGVGPLQFAAAVPLDGIADGPQQPPALHLALDQIVLRSLAQSTHGQRLVGVPRQHHHGGRGGMGLQLGQRLQPVTVGKCEIQKANVKLATRQLPPGLFDRTRPSQRKGTLADPIQRTLDQKRVVVAVLDQKDDSGTGFGSRHRPTMALRPCSAKCSSYRGKRRTSMHRPQNPCARRRRA